MFPATSAQWNSIRGTTESTTTTTTTTTTAPLEYTNDSEYETLEDLLTSIDYDFVRYSFYTANRAYVYYEHMENYEGFLETYVLNKNQKLTNNQTTIDIKSLEILGYSAWAKKYSEQFVCAINIYSYDHYGEIQETPTLFPHTTILIYYNGIVEVIRSKCTYMTIEEGSFDWDLFLKEYFYYFDIWGLDEGK